jgi:hypothetical protein
MESPENSPIFLLGRFRSGTTALWQLFERLPNHTAWYEPLHPNLLMAIQHTRPQASHRHVTDYWLTYRGLQEPLSKHWQRAFATRALYLEEGDEWPGLARYIDWMIKQSSGTPVIQFNRMDLRIGWLRKHYPTARIVTIRRQPLALWESCRAHLPKAEKNNENHPDAYELMQWSAALAQDFPFLAPQKGRHGYFRHYALWRMATVLADRHADWNLHLENMQQDVEAMARWLGWSATDTAVATAGLAPPEKSIAAEKPADFLVIEQAVEEILDKSGLRDGLGQEPLDTIKRKHPDYWQMTKADGQAVADELLHALYGREDEITRLLAVVEKSGKQDNDPEKR